MKLIEDFNGIPSLEFLTATQIFKRLWNSEDIVQAISDCLKTTDEALAEGIWKGIEDRVKTIFRSIEACPVPVGREIEFLINLVGFQIRAMRTFLIYSPYFYSELHDKFTSLSVEESAWMPDFYSLYLWYSNLEFPVNHWTHYGTVDTKRLERILVEDDRWDVFFRFHLACNECFEDILRELFPLLTDDQKMYYQNMNKDTELVNYWMNRLSDDLHSPTGRLASNPNVHFQEMLSFSLPYDEHSADGLAFKFILKNGSKSGFDYFQERLPPNVLEHVLQDYFRGVTLTPRDPSTIGWPPVRSQEHFSDALYFQLSKLDVGVRDGLVSINKSYILSSFLMYPFFGLFSKYVKLFIYEITRQQAYNLLQKVFCLESSNLSQFGYELFEEMWRVCPVRHMRYINTQLRVRDPDEVQRGMLEMISRIQLY